MGLHPHQDPAVSRAVGAPIEVQVGGDLAFVEGFGRCGSGGLGGALYGHRRAESPGKCGPYDQKIVADNDQ